MAKKSAASKGYRKTVKQKPFLTKKELIALIVIVAVIVVGLILFNVLYDDGFISASKAQPGDVLTFASRQSRSRFMKVGEIGEIEGFTRTDNTNDSNPIVTYTFTPDDETSKIQNINVSGSYNTDAKTAASTTLANLQQQFVGLNLTAAEIIETQVQDHPAYIMSYTYDYYRAPEADEVPADDAAPEAEADEVPADDAAPEAEADEAPADDAAPEAEADEAEATGEEEAPAEEPSEEETPASNVFNQNINCYVHIDDMHSLCMSIYTSGEDASFYLPEDQLESFALQFTTAFTAAVKE